MPAKAFTYLYPARSRELKNEVLIYSHGSPYTIRNPDKDKRWTALWDTGATGSVITKDVATELGLKPISVQKVVTPSGQYYAQSYYIDISLPNGVNVPGLLVVEGESSQWDILIGMDIISLGDFAVSNHDGKTSFTFRIPSLDFIDFVHNTYLKPLKVASKPGRNDPCPCGSGRKYKVCCEKK